MQAARIKVSTLNVWGLYSASNRKARIDAIGDFYATAGHDIVGFQELWIHSDYERLARRLRYVFPYHHYYKSGVMGSGLAVFARWPIVHIFFQRYLLGGKPEFIFHGDWYSGRGVAAARIQHPQAGTIDFYNTHLVATYSADPSRDIYLGQRLTEMYEMLQFIDHNTEPGNVAIAIGDFNSQPAELVYQLFLNATALLTNRLPHMRDTWLDFPDADRTSFGRRDNRYSSGKVMQQLDYILHMPNGRVRPIHMQLIMKGNIPGRAYPYSDHCGAEAAFHIRASAGDLQELPTRIDRKTLKSRYIHVRRAIEVVAKCLDDLKSRQMLFRYGALLMLGVFLLCIAYLTANFALRRRPWLDLVACWSAPLVLLCACWMVVMSNIAAAEEIAGLSTYLAAWSLWRSVHLPL